jgi:hypothetical protein
MDNSNNQEFLGLPMETNNTSAIVKLLSKSIPRLQFLRELTKNSFESMDPSSGNISVTWDFDGRFLKEGLYKLSITDTGCGLKEDELLQYINKLSSSGKILDVSENFGIGAKISGLAYSPFGVEYHSWVDGVGSYCKLKDLGQGNYGLEDLGDNKYTKKIELADAPKDILKKRSGTKIVLLGESAGSSTGIFDDKREMSKYLARRFYKFPGGVKLNVVEGPFKKNKRNVEHTQLREIISQKNALDSNSKSSGIFNDSAFNVHWWILNENVSDKNDSAQLINNLNGHFGILYQDELYEIFSDGTAINKMQEFGIKIGGKKIVLYLEVLNKDANPNPERTSILLNGEKLDLDSYGIIFSGKMPPEIRDYIDEKAKRLSADNLNWQEEIDRLLKNLGIGKLKKDVSGNMYAEFVYNDIIHSNLLKATKGSNNNSGMEAISGSSASLSSFKIPDVYFCSSRPELFPNTNVTEFTELTDLTPMEFDKAAKYVKGSNSLYINLDFRSLEKIISFVIAKFDENDPTILGLYKEYIINTYTYQILEAVVSVLLLSKSGKWTAESSSHALSIDALTAVAMVRSSVITKSLELIKNMKKD